MPNMHCLITGVAGFVGSSLADRLLRDGCKVKGIDCFLDYYSRDIKQANLTNALKNPNFELIDGNLLNLDLEKELAGITHVFHQAGQAGVRASWGKYFETYTANNILATQKLLEAAHAIRAQRVLEKIVYASSSSIYGNAESFPTTEKLTPKPVSPYGVTKLAAEHLVSLYASQYALPTVSLRYFTVFGPRQRPDMAFNRFIRSKLRDQEIVIYGDGQQTRDFTYIDDIVEANILAALKGNHGEVFNIGGGTQSSLNHILDLIQNNMGKLKVLTESSQLGDARHTSADTSKARSQLGYLPKVGLEDGIRAEIEWLKTSYHMMP